MSSDKHPQIFYLFGDNHVKSSDCGRNTKFHTWIKNTIINSPVFIDVYLESPYQYKDYPTVKPEDLANSYIHDFYSDFESCFIHSKDQSYCQTSRFHYTDTRRIAKTFEQRMGAGNKYDYIYNASSETEIIRNIKEVNEYIDFIINPSFIRNRILKQIKAIKDDKIREIILEEYARCLSKNEKGIRHIKRNEPNKFKVKEVLWAVSDYGLCVMDYYLIARCFRSYSRKEGYSRPSYNNIIYAGEAHIKKYVEILQKLGFHIDEKVPSKDKSKEFQCLNISGIKQPLFYQRYT